MRPLLAFSLASLVVWTSAQAQDVPADITPVGDIPLEASVEGLAFSPDSKTLLIHTIGVFWLCDVEKPAVRAPGIQGPHVHTGMDRPPGMEPVDGRGYMLASAAHFTPDSKTLVVRTFQTVQRWDVMKGTSLARPIPIPNALQRRGSAINPVTGDLLLTSMSTSFPTSPMGEVPLPVIASMLKPTTGKKVGKPMRLDQRPWPGRREDWGLQQVAFSPDGKQVAFLHFNGVVRLWDVKTGKELIEEGLSEADGESHLEWSPDGTRLLVHSPKGAQLWDPIGLKPVGALIKTGAGEGGDSTLIAHRAAFSPDSKILALPTLPGNPGQEMQIIDSATGKPRLTFTIRKAGALRGIEHMQFSGKHLFILQDFTRDPLVWLWDPETGKPLARPSVVFETHKAVISPDGKYLATVGYRDDRKRSVRIWRLP